MSGLLELRETLKKIYSKYEFLILPVVKFLLAFIVLNSLNSKLGYMTKIDNIAITFIVSLMCSFLPTTALVLIAGLYSLAHMYALSMEVAVVGAGVYLFMFLMFFRFSPKEALVVILTPLLCSMKIPYVMPIAMGLLGTPASAVSVGFGLAAYYYLQTVLTSATNISTMDDAEAISKIRLMIDGFIGNKEMMVLIVAFAITVVIVYILRRMSMDHSWTIAIIAGAMLNLMIIMVGDLLYDINISVVGVIFGSILAVAVAKVIEFFRFCVDYSRTEKVQFEDDEYYYYVKAVPKMSVAAPTKTVKKINSQVRSSVTVGRNSEPSQDDFEELF